MNGIRLVFIFSLTLCCGLAHADVIDITLSPGSLSGAPGSVLAFIGTLDNTTNADVFLNADNFSLSGLPPSAIDDSPFFSDTPSGLLSALGTTGNIGLFNIMIPSSFAPGVYDGTFQILGGTTPNDQTIVGSADFQVQVAQAPVAQTPEPGSVVLLFSLLLALGIVCRIGRQHVRFTEPHRAPVPSREKS